ncbi:MAG: helix-turn-helix domain-containing protein [Lachnospiraceae bacterium]|nr:helix-turn-helix domain-containing protein [Lachnospiraceae bacterium]
MDKQPGKRLQAARKATGMTQAELAIASGYASNYISMLERGDRSITWNRAATLAAALNVTPAYIMGETDAPINNTWMILDEENEIGAADKAVVNLLLALGIRIDFICVYVIADRELDEDRDAPPSAPRERHTIPAHSIERFSFSDHRCIAKDITGKHEAVIESVTINGTPMKYGAFCERMDAIQDFVCYLATTRTDIGEETYMDSMIREEIGDPPAVPPGLEKEWSELAGMLWEIHREQKKANDK